MTTYADTGNSATAVFTTAGLVGHGVREMGSLKQDGEKIDTSLLADTITKKYIPGDLYEPGSVEITVEHDVNVLPPAPHTLDTLTITYPLEPGSTAEARATLAGTGFFMSREITELKNNQIMVSKVVFQFNGLTGPTHTPEAEGSGS